MVNDAVMHMVNILQRDLVLKCLAGLDKLEADDEARATLVRLRWLPYKSRNVRTFMVAAT